MGKAQGNEEVQAKTLHQQGLHRKKNKMRGGAYKIRLEGARRPERKVLGDAILQADAGGNSLENKLWKQVSFMEKQIKKPVDSTGVRSYLRFCERLTWDRQRILPEWGRMVDNLILYVTDAVQTYTWNVGPLTFSKRAVKPETAAGYAREVAKWYAEEMATSDMVHKAPRLQAVVKLLREAMPAGSEQKEGLTSANMESVLRHLESVPHGKMWRAMMGMAWIGLLRPCEFVVPSQGKYDVTSHASVDNIIFYKHDVEVKPGSTTKPTRMVFVVKKSKTDQDRMTRDVVVGLTGSSWCPLTMMWDYLSEGARDGHESLFTVNKKPVTYKQMRKVLSEALKSVGLEPKCFGGHSFRIGGAQALAAAGKSIIYIMSYGRWRCVESVLRYVATPVFMRELDSRDMVLALADSQINGKEKVQELGTERITDAIDTYYERHAMHDKLWMSRNMVQAGAPIQVA